MFCTMQSDGLASVSESTDSDDKEGRDDTENAKDPQNVDVAVLPPEASPPPLRRSVLPHPVIYVIMRECEEREDLPPAMRICMACQVLLKDCDRH